MFNRYLTFHIIADILSIRKRVLNILEAIYIVRRRTKVVMTARGREKLDAAVKELTDQACAFLYLASKMGVHVKGQVLQVCNGAFL